jgi:hypothetical protein
MVAATAFTSSARKSAPNVIPRNSYAPASVMFSSSQITKQSNEHSPAALQQCR